MKLTYLAVSLLAVSAGALAAGKGASGGSFHIWEDNSNANLKTVVVSFAGDGKTQDSQADISHSADWKLVRASSKVQGSICVGFADKNLLRVVPPSGAGQSLSSSSVDYCSFQLQRVGTTGADSFAFKFTECASTSGVQKCGGGRTDVTK